MGYNTAEIRIPLRLDNHGGPEQAADRQAADDLRTRIEQVIADDSRFQRIARIGVEGP